jgi:hypothetical protein
MLCWLGGTLVEASAAKPTGTATSGIAKKLKNIRRLIPVPRCSAESQPLVWSRTSPILKYWVNGKTGIFHRYPKFHNPISNSSKNSNSNLHIHSRLKQTVLELDNDLNTARKEYENLCAEYEINTVSREQAAPIQEQINSLMNSLSTQNTQLKQEVARLKRKCQEAIDQHSLVYFIVNNLNY